MMMMMMTTTTTTTMIINTFHVKTRISMTEITITSNAESLHAWNRACWALSSASSTLRCASFLLETLGPVLPLVDNRTITSATQQKHCGLQELFPKPTGLSAPWNSAKRHES